MTGRARSWLAYAGLLAAYVVLAVEAGAPLHNTDTYFHLRFGHEFLSGHWSLRDPGSPTSFGTAHWVPTQWLTEVVMARVEGWFGLAGVAWLSGLLFLTLTLSLYAACRRWSEPLVATVITALALVGCSTGLSMRPQMVSYVLVVATTVAWLRARETRRAPWWLVPVTWVWTTCHGMWPLGIVIGLVAVLGLALDGRLRSRRVLLRMAAVPLLSAVAVLLTPAGPGLLPAVLRVTSRAQYFYEWSPPDFTRPIDATVLLLLALALVPRLRTGRPVPWLDLGLLGLAVLWTVYSQRTVPVAACMAAVLAASAVQPLVGSRPAVARDERLAVVGGFVAVLATLAVVVPHTADRPRDEPSWLDDRLDALPADTVLLDDTGLGGYLMWAHPHLDFVMNGYGDTFTDAELERNADMDGGRPGWLEDVRSTGAAYAVLKPGSPLAYDLRNLESWSVVEVSDDLELLAPPDGWYASSGASTGGA